MVPIATHRASSVLIGIGALALAGALVDPGYGADTAEIYVVQGLPGQSLVVKVDGKAVDNDVATAKVVGPFDIEPGRRTVTFSDGGDVVLERALTVEAGSSSDVVAHLPASASAAPMVTVFKNDLSAVPRGKATLTVAHTAAVPPADIRVDGKVLFENVANGESLTLVVPAGTYSVDIVPTGKNGPAVLGPLDLTVKAGGLDRVFAVGDPAKKTMNVAVHVIATGSTGSGQPARVDTGTGGQAVGYHGPMVTNLVR
jgi:hypothetical protein